MNLNKKEKIKKLNGKTKFKYLRLFCLNIAFQ